MGLADGQDAALYSPTRALWILLRSWWAGRRCGHPEWTPLDGCPDCGKEPS